MDTSTSEKKRKSKTKVVEVIQKDIINTNYAIIPQEEPRVYKKRSRRKEAMLETEVLQLQQDIHRLHGKRDCMLDFPLKATSLNERHSTKIMIDYCRIFENGYNLKNANEGIKQEQFLRSIMRDDLRIIGVTFKTQGLDKLIGAHRMYTTNHPSYHQTYLQCENILDDMGAVLVCELRTISTQRITRQMLQMYYPMVFQHEALVQRLIGEMIDISVTQLFEFDNLGRIEAYVPRIEAVQAFANLLQKFEFGSLCALEHQLRIIFQ